MTDTGGVAAARAVHAAGDTEPVTEPVIDGRAARWQRHREERRVELVDATLVAIRTHGAGVGMDEIAALAGTSKTVIYRHFEDRAGLYRAVVERVDSQIMGEILASLGRMPARDGEASDAARATIRSTIDTYLALVERDPEVYRFVVHPPLETGPAGSAANGIANRVVEAITGLLGTVLTADDAAQAHTWAVAIVGSARAVSDEWLSSPAPKPREELVDALTALAWHGLAPVLR